DGRGVAVRADDPHPPAGRPEGHQGRDGHQAGGGPVRGRAPGLGLMDHPAIARVYDAGETDRGLPYFAMEYVKGEPITSYCDRHRLPTRERLELVMQVCDGVQHA